MDGGDRVAAADDDRRAIRGRIGHRARDAYGSLFKTLLLEDAHRAVPDDGLRALQLVREERDRLAADVQTDKSLVGELDGDGLAAVKRVVAVHDLMVGGENEFDSLGR